MRVFAGGITTETNTFPPVPIGLDDFILACTGTEDAPCECQILRTLRQLTASENWTFCPAFIAFAEPGGTTTRKAYEHLREQLLTELKKNLPVDIDVEVKSIIPNFIQPFPQGENESIPLPCGDAVCLECDGIYIIVNSTRTQVFHPKVFTAFGLDISGIKVLIVKSIFHFHAGFAPIAEQILMMGAPGPLNARFTEVPYQKADLNKYPWIDNPNS